MLIPVVTCNGYGGMNPYGWESGASRCGSQNKLPSSQVNSPGISLVLFLRFLVKNNQDASRPRSPIFTERKIGERCLP